MWLRLKHWRGSPRSARRHVPGRTTKKGGNRGRLIARSSHVYTRPLRVIMLMKFTAGIGATAVPATPVRMLHFCACGTIRFQSMTASRRLNVVCQTRLARCKPCSANTIGCSSHHPNTMAAIGALAEYAGLAVVPRFHLPKAQTVFGRKTAPIVSASPRLLGWHEIPARLSGRAKQTWHPCDPCVSPSASPVHEVDEFHVASASCAPQSPCPLPQPGRQAAPRCRVAYGRECGCSAAADVQLEKALR